MPRHPSGPYSLEQWRGCWHFRIHSLTWMFWLLQVIFPVQQSLKCCLVCQAAHRTDRLCETGFLVCAEIKKRKKKDNQFNLQFYSCFIVGCVTVTQPSPFGLTMAAGKISISFCSYDLSKRNALNHINYSQTDTFLYCLFYLLFLQNRWG